MTEKKNYRISFALITVLFFFLGFITVLVDSLIPRLRELFELTYFQAGMVQFAFFSAYFLLSIPSSFIINKIGYKGGIISGLSTLALGCLLFYPAAEFRSFGIFILGYFTLAGGMTLLQVAINPFVAVLGHEKSASGRLTLAQAFNSLGTAIAPIVGATLILSDKIKSKNEISQLSENAQQVYLTGEASAVQFPFVWIALMIGAVAVIFIFISLPKLIQTNSSGTYFSLFKKKNLMLGVMGIFFYVGAEVAIGSYLVNYFLDMNLVPLIKSNETMRYITEVILNSALKINDQKAVVGVFVAFYWTGAMLGRFFGSYLLKKINPGLAIAIFAFFAIQLIVVSISTNGLISMWAILAVGLCNSIMFPTIFTLAIGGLKELKPKASGLLCMAIVGGAIIPPMFGYLTDLSDFKTALTLIVCCYIYILFFGYYNFKLISKGK